MKYSFCSTRITRTTVLQWCLRIPSRRLWCFRHTASSGQRRYSSIVPSKSEDVQIQTRSNGQITLSIHHAYIKNPESPIVLYLPNGPFNPSFESGNAISQLASLAPRSTFVKVNYRFTTPHQFPTPIHDAVAGYDWVRENLVRSSSEMSTPSQHLAVCGNLLGGSLAAMLALTECSKTGPSIKSACITNPILDWTFPDSVPQPSSPKPKASKASKLASVPSWERLTSNNKLKPSDLLSARTLLFRQLENTLDPFASPLLFFRTPLVSYEMDEEADATLRIARIPMHHRRYPPAHSGLQIPRIRVSVDKNYVLYDQAAEFVTLLRRSVMNSERGAGQRYLDGEDESGAATEDAMKEAERRIGLEEEGVGIDNAVESMGRWAAGLSE